LRGGGAIGRGKCGFIRELYRQPHFHSQTSQKERGERRVERLFCLRDPKTEEERGGEREGGVCRNRNEDRGSIPSTTPSGENETTEKEEKRKKSIRDGGSKTIRGLPTLNS